MNVLVACEESQEVCKAFRSKGHNAFSCDIQDCSGGHPEWHIKGDVLNVLNPREFMPPDTFYWEYGIPFVTQDGKYHEVFSRWDLIIAHPPCTYLTVTGNRWFNTDKYGEKAVRRHCAREDAILFFMSFVNADCERICIENPIGVMSTKYRKADQIINPTMFGHPYDKKTCLWLKGLNCLVATNIVNAEPRILYSSGRTMPAWYANIWNLPPLERSKARSKTFPGVAKAMAEQWG